MEKQAKKVEYGQISLYGALLQVLIGSMPLTPEFFLGLLSGYGTVYSLPAFILVVVSIYAGVRSISSSAEPAMMKRKAFAGIGLTVVLVLLHTIMGAAIYEYSLVRILYEAWFNLT